MRKEWQEMIGREFRHFKGNLYRLEGFAKDSETLEEMVVYRALYGDGGLWVRSASPMRTKVKWVKSLWRFPHSVPKCLIYVALLFAVKAAKPACIL